MTTHRRFAALTSSVLAAACLSVPVAAHADPAPAPGPAPLVPTAPVLSGSFISTQAFPMPAAKWAPVTRPLRTSPYLNIIERCTPAAGPTTLPGHEQRPTAMVGHAMLSPGDPAATKGWALEVSAATYSSGESARLALASLKGYIDSCEKMRPNNTALNDIGIARNDPTMGGAVIVTNDTVVVEWIVATDEGLIELTAMHPVVDDISLDFNTAGIISSLRGAKVSVLVPEVTTEPGPGSARQVGTAAN